MGISINQESFDKELNGSVKVLISLYQNRAASVKYQYILDKRNGAYRVIRITFPERPIFFMINLGSR